MTDYSIQRFISMYKNGTLADDITYRAYDLEWLISPQKTKAALKHLGYRQCDVGPALEEFKRYYGVANAGDVLAMWWSWRRLQLGIISKAKLRSKDDE